MLPTIRPATKDDHADETDDEMLGGEETDERANLLGGGNKEAGGEDDDFFLNGPKVKISGLRSQVDQVTSVMRNNIERVLERGQNLDELNLRSENLHENSESFRTQADRLRRRAWCNNTKTKFAIGGVVLVILIIIIIIASN